MKLSKTIGVNYEGLQSLSDSITYSRLKKHRWKTNATYLLCIFYAQSHVDCFHGVHRWRIVWKCGCRSTHFAVVHPHKLVKHPWRTSDTVLVVRHGCSIHFCGCTTSKWVLRHPHFHTIIHLWWCCLLEKCLIRSRNAYGCCGCLRFAMGVRLIWYGCPTASMGVSTPTVEYNSPPMNLSSNMFKTTQC